MTETETEKYLSLAEIARRYGFDVDTVRNWIVRGVPIAGQQVRLEGVRIGWAWRVPLDAWERFLALCNPDTHVESAERQEANRRAAQEASRSLDRELGGRRKKRKAR
jgi:hypothetical protein